MPTAVEHVEAAVAAIASAIESLDAAPSEEIVSRLSAASELLQSTTDRFFVQSRLGVPFARRCQTAAEAVGAAIAEGSPEEIEAALANLEKQANTLDERSKMQGMALT